VTVSWTDLESVHQKLREASPGKGAYVTLSAYMPGGGEKSVGRWDEGAPDEVMEAIRYSIEEQQERGVRKCRIRFWSAGGAPVASVTSHLQEAPMASPRRPGEVRQPTASAEVTNPPQREPARPSSGACLQCRRLGTELKDARLEIRSLKNLNTNAVADVNEEMEKVGKLEKELSKFKQALGTMKAERDAVALTNRRLASQVSDLKRRLAGVTAELEASQSQNVAWQEGFDNVNAMLDDDDDQDGDDEDDEGDEDDE